MTDGVIERFITSGLSDEARARIGDLPRGHGFLGLIIHENGSFRIRDINTDPPALWFSAESSADDELPWRARQR